jgi:hypothetical protein
MTMPWLGVFIFKERFFELNVDQVARFESVVLKEVASNPQLLKSLEGKLGDISKYKNPGS